MSKKSIITVLLIACLLGSVASALDGLMLHWPLDEGEGTVIVDASGNGYDGIFSDDRKATGVFPSWDANGVSGSAVSVEDVYAFLKSNATVPMNNVDFSVSLWVKPKTSGGAVISNWGAGAYPPGSNFAVYCEGTQIRVNHYQTDDVTGVVDVPNGEWTLVVVTEKVGVADSNGVIDPNVAAVTIYANGAEVGSGNIVTFNQVDNNLYVGARCSGKKNNFNGVVDDVKVYDRVLTAHEVHAGQAALVVGNPDLSAAFDAPIYDRLVSLGYDVTIVDDDNVSNDDPNDPNLLSTTNASAYDVVVISESCGSSAVTELAYADVPIMDQEAYGWSRKGYTTNEGKGWGPVVTLADIMDDTHPIAVDANLTGEALLFEEPGLAGQVIDVKGMAVDAVSVVQVPDSNSVIVWTLEKGGVLATGDANDVAVNRICGFGLIPGSGAYDVNLLTYDGWALFDAAIRWLDPAPVKLPEPIADYSFDVDASDATGNFDGTLEGDAAIVEDAERGNVLSLTANGYVSVPPAVTDTMDNFSFATWVHFGGSIKWAGLLGMGVNTAGIAPYWDFHLRGDGSGTLSFYSAKTTVWPSGSCAQIVDSYTMPAVPEWVHIAFSFTKNEGAVVYINGVAQTTSPWTGPNTFHISPSDIAAEVVTIGKDAFNQNTLTNTMIDDFKFYNIALSAEDVAAIYNAE